MGINVSLSPEKEKHEQTAQECIVDRAGIVGVYGIAFWKAGWFWFYWSDGQNWYTGNNVGLPIWASALLAAAAEWDINIWPVSAQPSDKPAQ